MGGDGPVNEFTTDRLEAEQRVLLIRSHKSAIAHDIRRQHGCQPPLNPFFRQNTILRLKDIQAWQRLPRLAGKSVRNRFDRLLGSPASAAATPSGLPAHAWGAAIHAMSTKSREVIWGGQIMGAEIRARHVPVKS